MYSEIFKFVKHQLRDNDSYATKSKTFLFRKRSEHIWRVYKWVDRIIENGNFYNCIDKESVLIASLFHDVGYSLNVDGVDHASSSVLIFKEYAKNTDFDSSKQEFIEYLICNHSRKELLKLENTPLELIILMEADLLDETGALSIIWDAMAEGAQKDQSFEKTREHIKNYTWKIMLSNPMHTEITKKYWAEKQKLVTDFIHQLEMDLFVIP